jgi:hypothetical protein
MYTNPQVRISHDASRRPARSPLQRERLGMAVAVDHGPSAHPRPRDGRVEPALELLAVLRGGSTCRLLLRPRARLSSPISKVEVAAVDLAPGPLHQKAEWMA